MGKATYYCKPEQCRSTHGGSGYVSGSYWDNGAIVCGMCGERIENPPPTGSFEAYQGADRVPTYPGWIGGIPAERTGRGLFEADRQTWWTYKLGQRLVKWGIIRLGQLLIKWGERA